MKKWNDGLSASSGLDYGLWSCEAAADFAAIVEYIRKQNPSAAERVANEISDGASLGFGPRARLYNRLGHPGNRKLAVRLAARPCETVECVLGNRFDPENCQTLVCASCEDAPIDSG